MVCTCGGKLKSMKEVQVAKMGDLDVVVGLGPDLPLLYKKLVPETMECTDIYPFIYWFILCLVGYLENK